MIDTTAAVFTEPWDAPKDSSESETSREGLETKISAGLEQVEVLLIQQTETTRANTTEISSHLRSAGGKRMRPLLTLLTSQLGKPHSPLSPEVLQAAAAVELTHLASLYHDDLMDAAKVRRGVNAAHVQWNNTLAVMAGDLIFSRASQIVSELGPEYVKRHAHTFERLCLGQMDDIFGCPPQEDPLEFYLHVLREKTGSLIGTASYYGAALSQCDEDVTQALTCFGEDMGVAFQIADDVLDLRSTAQLSGKTPGADLREGTKTMPVLLLEKQVAAGRGGAQDRKLLDSIADTQSLKDDAALADVVAKLSEHRVTAETIELAQEWVDRSLLHLNILPESQVKRGLTEFAHLQINRLK